MSLRFACVITTLLLLQESSTTTAFNLAQQYRLANNEGSGDNNRAILPDNKEASKEATAGFQQTQSFGDNKKTSFPQTQSFGDNKKPSFPQTQSFGDNKKASFPQTQSFGDNKKASFPQTQPFGDNKKAQTQPFGENKAATSFAQTQPFGENKAATGFSQNENTPNNNVDKLQQQQMQPPYDNMQQQQQKTSFDYKKEEAASRSPRTETTFGGGLLNGPVSVSAGDNTPRTNGRFSSSSSSFSAASSTQLRTDDRFPVSHKTYERTSYDGNGQQNTFELVGSSLLNGPVTKSNNNYDDDRRSNNNEGGLSSMKKNSQNDNNSMSVVQGRLNEDWSTTKNDPYDHRSLAESLYTRNEQKKYEYGNSGAGYQDNNMNVVQGRLSENWSTTKNDPYDHRSLAESLYTRNEQEKYEYENNGAGYEPDKRFPVTHQMTD